eukprot:6152721-Pleurochrysis_carterae.AAC.1
MIAEKVESANAPEDDPCLPTLKVEAVKAIEVINLKFAKDFESFDCAHFSVAQIDSKLDTDKAMPLNDLVS